MAKFELKLPKMGESVAEATITNWLKEVGDTIEEDEAVLEIATDKVDSEVPSEVDGVLVEKLFGPDDVVQVGQTIAIIETEGEIENTPGATSASEQTTETSANVAAVEETVSQAKATASNEDYNDSDRFYSPLVKNIAKEENISFEELESVKGTGKDGRVTKDDI
ncbi:E3 binding domain-containing protein, partial [Aquimarina celericrescens]|nr:E3 binding domain-containing protein [Aquimarina celericrescens]